MNAVRDLASPAECAARAERIQAHQIAARHRAKDLLEARALIRKHGLQTDAEVMDMLCCIAASLHFNYDEIKDRLTEMACDLEGFDASEFEADDSWKRRQDRALGGAS